MEGKLELVSLYDMFPIQQDPDEFAEFAFALVVSSLPPQASTTSSWLLWI